MVVIKLGTNDTKPQNWKYSEEYVLDYEAIFKANVIDPFIAEYKAGRTPIPCINCNEKVKFLDLKSQYLSIKTEIDNAIQSVINDTAFIKGKYVDDFESEFSKIYGIKNTVSCGIGTDAIYILLKSLGISKGDEVITVSNTWISTSETVSQVGGKPVFVDCEQDSFTIDPRKIEAKINAKKETIFETILSDPEDSVPIAIIAPTIITAEIAFVTDIRGVCKAGVTDHTT